VKGPGKIFEDQENRELRSIQLNIFLIVNEPQKIAELQKFSDFFIND
jgi:hypothetical protein